MDKKRNWLLSYPRSGNSWLRYCIETLTNKRTIGYLNSDDKDKSILLDVRGKEIILTKRHGPSGVHNNNSNKIILLVRDYHEVLPRHKEKKYSIMDEFEANLGVDFNYLKLLEFYDSFIGEKIIIYYEDLILNLHDVLIECNNFLDLKIDGSEIENFLNDLAKHKEKSLKRYKDSKTKGDLNIKHSDIFSENEIIENQQWLKKNKPIIYDKYLKRYDRFN